MLFIIYCQQTRALRTKSKLHLPYHPPSTTTSPQVTQGTGAVVSPFVPATPSWSLFYCPDVGFLPQDAVLPELILCGLPTGSSSPSTAPTWLHITMPTLQALLHMAPPALLPHCGMLPTGCSSGLGLLLWGYPRAVVFRSHPLLHHRPLHGCMWTSALQGAHGLQGSACSSMGPSRAARTFCSVLEYLLPSFQFMNDRKKSQDISHCLDSCRGQEMLREKYGWELCLLF